MSGASKIAPFGTWSSPISADLLSGGRVGIDEVEVDGREESSPKIFYLESRPAENGRSCIVEYSADGTRDVLPSAYNARSTVHEYGGAAFIMGPDGNIVFADHSTKGVYVLTPGSMDVQPILEANPELRYANFNVHPTSTNWVLAVQEDHRTSSVENRLVAIDAKTKNVHVIAEGSDFYAHPKFSPDGSKICWTEWNHPDMPWTGTVLSIADWEDGRIGSPRVIAGKAREESISQPRWGFDGTLYFASDLTGYWQLYKLKKGSTDHEIIKLEGLETTEFAGPEWLLGSSTYVLLTVDTIVAACTKNGANRLIIIDLKTGTHKETDFGLVDVEHGAMKRVSDTKFVVIGSTEISPKALYLFDITTSGGKILKKSADIDFPTGLYSRAEHISFPRTYSKEQDPSGVAHAFYLPPKSLDYQAPEGTLPPLIMSLHGGPTSHRNPGLVLSSQYWTSRGYAVVEVNYVGSSGYGRKYRDLLNGKWGLSDAEDTASCAEYLISTSRCDPRRIGIVGGSAGGYGVLQALCCFPKVWAGGVSLYGIAEVKALLSDTHKFESFYGDFLLFDAGATEAERKKVLHDRSPCYFAGNITAPTLLLQGSEDKVVPPNQALEMEKAIKENGGEVKVVIFEGEGHGFRKGSNILQAKQEEEAWWVKTLLK